MEPTLFEQIITQATIEQYIIPGEGQGEEQSNLRKTLQYFCAMTDKECPWQSPREFQVLIRNYTPWHKFQSKVDTKRLIVHIPGKILYQALSYHTLTKRTRQEKTRDDLTTLFTQKPQSLTFATINDDQPTIPALTTQHTVLITPPGLGKTNALVNYLAQQPRSTPMVVISFRVALSKKQQVDLAPLAFVHYSNIHSECIDLDKHQRVIVQIDSLLRLRGDRKDIILVIDEWESLFDHLYTSPFITKRSEIAEYLTDIIKHRSRQILIADANFTPISNEFLRRVCRITPVIYHNTYIRQERIAHFLASKGQLVTKIIELLRSGEKIYVPVNSKLFAEYLFQVIVSDPILSKRYPTLDPLCAIFSSDTTLAENIDPIHEIIKYDCCIVTPRFQAGNSFVAEHFDRVCAYFTAASCSPEAASQLLMRVRNVRHPEVYLVIDNKLAPGKRAQHRINTFEDMHQYIMHKNHIRSQSHQFLSSKYTLSHLKFKFDSTVDIEDPSTYLGLMCAFNTNNGHKNYLAHLVPILRRMGFRFGSYTGMIESERSFNNEVTKGMRKLRDFNQRELAQSIVDTNLISEREYWRLVDQGRNEQGERNYGSLKIEERLQIKKYRLYRLFRFLRPHNVDDVEKALKMKYLKKLVVRLLPLGRIDNPEDEHKHLQEVLEDLAYNSQNPAFVVQRFYQLAGMDRALMIGYLLSCVRAIGFRSFFDPLPVIVNREGLIKYINTGNNKMIMEEIFGKKFTAAQLTKDKIMPWLSDKLKILNISIERIDKKCQKKDDDGNTVYKACLKSPWRIGVVDNEIKLLYHGLETEIDNVDYLISYPATMAKMLEIPYQPQERKTVLRRVAMLSPTYDEEGYRLPYRDVEYYVPVDKHGRIDPDEDKRLQEEAIQEAERAGWYGTGKWKSQISLTYRPT